MERTADEKVVGKKIPQTRFRWSTSYNSENDVFLFGFRVLDVNRGELQPINKVAVLAVDASPQGHESRRRVNLILYIIKCGVGTENSLAEFSIHAKLNASLSRQERATVQISQQQLGYL